MNPFDIIVIVFGFIALVGLFIILFDKGIKRRS
jgi:preprotein translocase subunit SecE